jgi:hypothetical protein
MAKAAKESANRMGDTMAARARRGNACHAVPQAL